MDFEANFTDDIFYDATDGADQDMDIWEKIVCEDFSSISPNDNEDDNEINIDWNDITFDDLNELMPNESEEADITIDNSDKNEEADDNKMRPCNNTYKLRSLKQLIGTWEIDGNAIKNKTADEQPGVCDSHFQFDMKDLHEEGAKQLIDSENGYIHYRICLFCNKLKCFFSRGKYCREHSWKINDRNIQIPCIGNLKCKAFSEGSIVQKTLSSYNARYICSACYEQQGGHLYIRRGKGHNAVSCHELGKHNDDQKKAIRHFGNWVMSVAEFGDDTLQKRFLSLLPQMFTIFDEPTTTPAEPLSELSVKIALKLGERKLKNAIKRPYAYTSENIQTMGQNFGRSIFSSRSEIRQNVHQLEEPSSFEKYSEAIPSPLRNFFESLFTVLFEKRLAVVNKKREQRGISPRLLDTDHITKVTTLYASMLLTIAFPGLKVWFTHMLSSLCQKPKLLPRKILYTAGIVSYTRRHERSLERYRRIHTDPTVNIIKGPGIFNLAVIDNIDFKAATFARGNIFDVTRQSSHALLRMLFQFTLPEPLGDTMDIDSVSLPLFSESSFTDKLLQNYESTFNTMLDDYRNEFDTEVLSEIAKQVQIGCNVPQPNVVILEPGKAPNCDDNVHDACEMYWDELSISSNEQLYIACDQAIFARLISYKEEHPNVQ
ncbi:6058_t:CDS:2, partial [Paraglomus occultum]